MVSHLSPPVVPEEADPLYEVVSYLGAVLIQADRDDDPIIIEHVRAAYRLPLDLHRKTDRERAHA